MIVQGFHEIVARVEVDRLQPRTACQCFTEQVLFQELCAFLYGVDCRADRCDKRVNDTRYNFSDSAIACAYPGLGTGVGTGVGVGVAAGRGVFPPPSPPLPLPGR